MPIAARKITPCLWFDTEAEQAANVYCSVFENSRVGKISRYGEEGPCGWLKDKFGLSWQVIPTALLETLAEGDTEKAQRVTKAFLHMKKFDIAALQRAYDGAGR